MTFDVLGFRPWTIATAAMVVMAQPTVAQEQTRNFNIGPQSLATALTQFGRQSGHDILFSKEIVGSRQTQGVQGARTPAEALTLLLQGSDLQFRTNEDGTYLVEVRRAETPPPPRTTDDAARREGAKSEILVLGRRTLNVDIRRSEDDAQPYVVYSGEEARASGAQNLEEFFRQRLPMNGQVTNGLSGYIPSTFNTSGGINLRGLGTNQTLILIDGRRVPGVAMGFDFGQPNINGISMSAIERIEILPSTASGAYGGGATGGVINIILKRDFSGLEVSALYGDTFDTEARRVELSLNGGFSLGGTRFAISASHLEQQDLLSDERDFGRRAFDKLAGNYPDYPSLAYMAYGPTPNVVSVTGENLVLDSAYGGAALNAPWTYVPAGYAGPGSDNAAALRANAGQLNVTGQPFNLYSGPTIDSVSLDIRRDLTSKLEVYANLYWDRSVNNFSIPQVTTLYIPGASAANPFQQDIYASLPVHENGVYSGGRNEIGTRRANVGLIARLPFDWSATLDYGWSKIDTTVVNGFTIGPSFTGTSVLEAAALTDLRAFPIANAPSQFDYLTITNPDLSNSLQDVSLRLSGPVTQLPGGPLTLSGLLEHRREYYDDFITSNLSAVLPPLYSWYPAGDREVDSAYLELRAPLIRQLELMGAVRRDKYETNWAAQQIGVPSPEGPFPEQTYSQAKLASTDYTLGLRYSPVQDVALRASFGTGFVPPSLSNIKPREIDFPAANLTTLFDPKRGGTRLTGDPVTRRVLVVRNGDPDLQPEESESLSYGFIFTPRVIQGLRLSVDLTEITKSGEINSPGEQFFINNEALYPDRVRRAANLPTDPAGWAGPITYIKASSVNLLDSTVRALDFQLDYTRDTRWGNWHFYLVATDQLKFERQISAVLPAEDRVGFDDGMIQWRGNAGFDWKAGPWMAGWNTQYYDGYSLCFSTETADSCSTEVAVLSQGTSKVPSQTYHDAFLRYSFDDSAWSPLANTDVNLGVQNVFDTSPPILAMSLYAAYGDARLRRFTLTVRKHFGADRGR